jgi:hypothetical protein
VALETVWKIIPHRATRDIIPSWTFNTRELDKVNILWPTKYEWDEASGWVDPIRQGFCRYVHVESADIPQNYKGIALIQMLIHGKKHHFAIDYSDRPDIDEGCARLCLRYFKMQFSCDGYALENVIPGGFIPFKDAIYTYLPHVRALGDRKSYRYDVYGRFGLEFARDIRRKACSILASQNYFHWEGSLRVKRYGLSLWEIAHSKICIDLPGNGDFCFRLIDYMAVGTCVIAARHHTLLPVPLVDGVHIVYIKDDLSDLVDLCRFYLEQPDARETLCRNTRSYFDKYLHRDQLAAYYLHTCLKLAS